MMVLPHSMKRGISYTIPGIILLKTHLRNISDTSNKLGIYSAELIDGIWTNIKPFKFNNPLYSFCTPALSPDGERIYFSSDMPGGYGGMDLYYCDSIIMAGISP